MYYDIIIKVTPLLLEKHPEYAGVDKIVLATAYTKVMATMIQNLFAAMADDGSEITISERSDSNAATESMIIGVFTDD